MLKFREGDPPVITLAAIEAEVAQGGAMLDAINREVKKHKGRIDKIAFAKALVDVCKDPSRDIQPHVKTFLDRMRVVFRAVNEAVRRATEDAANKKLETVVSERAGLFRVDNPNYATREQANIALRQIETQLDDSPEAEAIRNAMIPLRREHRLHEDPAQRITDYHAFLEELQGLKHAFRAKLVTNLQPNADTETRDDIVAKQPKRLPRKTSNEGEKTRSPGSKTAAPVKTVKKRRPSRSAVPAPAEPVEGL